MQKFRTVVTCNKLIGLSVTQNSATNLKFRPSLFHYCQSQLLNFNRNIYSSDRIVFQYKPTIFKTNMSSSGQASFAVEHDSNSNKFFIKLGSDEAKLEYVKNGDTLDMWHTEVPPALQGKGIAKILAKEAFDFAVKNNLRMLLSCSYLQKYYLENPKDEYKNLVIQ